MGFAILLAQMGILLMVGIVQIVQQVVKHAQQHQI